MKKELSAYWWCQIIGWGLFILFGTYFYFSGSGIAHFPDYSSIIITALLGLLSSHLMRLFIIKANILNQRIWKQIISMFLTTVLFSFIYLIFQWGEFLLVRIQVKPEDISWKAMFVGISMNFQFFIVWNFIYFTYHYIKKSQQEQVERVRLEAELKIQQLESDKAQIEYQRNLGNYYLMALRYQMNPHFIFNCLNSIKLYIIQNDTASASEYLTKFSKLIRLVMENSAKGKILLASELDMLRLYIDMEAMRFKEKLQYNIHLEKDVEPDYIELPPLLLQPYVENAIWHGLMPKEEGGRIDIEVAMNNDKSLLQIIITDNGIGRAKSADLGNGKQTKHESYGMKVTSDRIALINQVYKSGAEVKINDLSDANGNASGTKVMLQIPV
jgi:sensor histidine kinase YesM